MESSGIFIGREDPIATLMDKLEHPEKHRNLRILSICGPGGIGKTHLLEHIVSLGNVEGHWGSSWGRHGYLLLRTRGTNSPMGDIVTDQLLRNMIPNELSSSIYFKRTRACSDLLDRMDVKAKRRVLLSTENKQVSDAVNAIFALGRGAQNLSPKLKEYIDLDSIDERHIDTAVNLILNTKVHSAIKSLWPRGFDVFNFRLQDDLLKDQAGTLAECLISDIKELLLSRDYERNSVERIMWIIDDYEGLKDRLEGYLLKYLLPQIKNSSVRMDLLIAGRDAVKDTNIEWEKDYRQNLLKEIRLEEFDKKEAEELCRKSGIIEKNAIAKILSQSYGYPFLLASNIEDFNRGGSTALSINHFVDRTTKWMAVKQRHWALALAYLKEINVDTIQRVLPNETATEVLEWFKGESSLRSPFSNTWQILPVIRQKMMESVSIDAPSRHKKLIDAARK